MQGLISEGTEERRSISSISGIMARRMTTVRGCLLLILQSQSGCLQFGVPLSICPALTVSLSLLITSFFLGNGLSARLYVPFFPQYLPCCLYILSFIVCPCVFVPTRCRRKWWGATVAKGMACDEWYSSWLKRLACALP